MDETKEWPEGQNLLWTHELVTKFGLHLQKFTFFLKKLSFIYLFWSFLKFNSTYLPLYSPVFNQSWCILALGSLHPLFVKCSFEQFKFPNPEKSHFNKPFMIHKYLLYWGLIESKSLDLSFSCSPWKRLSVMQRFMNLGLLRVKSGIKRYKCLFPCWLW